ncbi:MAG: FIG00820885: hypothetical protein, partial [uncultured Frankineae bacterium]
AARLADLARHEPRRAQRRPGPAGGLPRDDGEGMGAGARLHRRLAGRPRPAAALHGVRRAHPPRPGRAGRPLAARVGAVRRRAPDRPRTRCVRRVARRRAAREPLRRHGAGRHGRRDTGAARRRRGLLRPRHVPHPARGAGGSGLGRRAAAGRLPALLRAQAHPHRGPGVRL